MVHIHQEVPNQGSLVKMKNSLHQGTTVVSCTQEHNRDGALAHDYFDDDDDGGGGGDVLDPD